MMTRILSRGVLLLMTLILSIGVATAEKPKLVVNIVVGSMRASDLDRYSTNFLSGGFRRMINGGTRYTDAQYSFSHITTPACLATLATGTQPSVHGIVGSQWWNYIDDSRVELAVDNKVRAADGGVYKCNYSANGFTAPTIGDMLLMADSQSKQYTIAIEPVSAITLNGKSGVALWTNSKAQWVTSTAYANEIPEWLDKYNDKRRNTELPERVRWTPHIDIRKYKNSEVAVVEDIRHKSTRLISTPNLATADTTRGKMLYTPVGNAMLFSLAETLIKAEGLGMDEHPDILNLYLDTARNIAEVYGPESIEYEDMVYRLDDLLAYLFTFLYKHFDDAKDIVVILTADHGTSPSYNPAGGYVRERFNPRQMAVLTNAYLGAHYGSADYILGVANNAVYLNHNTLTEKKLSLNDIREEVAIFLLKSKGVANALSASSLRNNSFASGRSLLMQNGFYPTRSGDVLLDLMPGCIIDDGTSRSGADGGYGYDRKVPLIIYRNGKATTISREVDMTSVAPTIAEILGIDAPWASDAEPLEEYK